MEQIEAILFDLDNTLVQYERSPGEVLRASFEIVGSDSLFSVKEYYARYDEFAEQCDSMDEFRSECFAALATENGYDRQRGRNVADTFSGKRDQTNVELLPSVTRVLNTHKLHIASVDRAGRGSVQATSQGLSGGVSTLSTSR